MVLKNLQKKIIIYNDIIVYIMIIGHGVDIVSIDRIKNVYDNFQDRFIAKILSNSEIKTFNQTGNDKKIHFLSKTWTIKESVSKAIGCGLINGSNLHFLDITLNKNLYNKPIVEINDKMFNIIKQINNMDNIQKKQIKIHVSNSHDGYFAIASVIIELIQQD